MSKSKMKFAIRDGGTTNDNTPTKNHIDECAAIFSIELGVVFLGNGINDNTYQNTGSPEYEI